LSGEGGGWWDLHLVTGYKEKHECEARKQSYLNRRNLCVLIRHSVILRLVCIPIIVRKRAYISLKVNAPDPNSAIFMLVTCFTGKVWNNCRFFFAEWMVTTFAYDLLG
jgi:hypothetical protein